MMPAGASPVRRALSKRRRLDAGVQDLDRAFTLGTLFGYRKEQAIGREIAAWDAGVVQGLQAGECQSEQTSREHVRQCAAPGQDRSQRVAVIVFLDDVAQVVNGAHLERAGNIRMAHLGRFLDDVKDAQRAVASSVSCASTSIATLWLRGSVAIKAPAIGPDFI